MPIMRDDLDKILLSESEIQRRISEMAADIERDYEGRDLLLVGVLKGAVNGHGGPVRALSRHVEIDWMAVSSYGSGTKSTGVVRILKDLDARPHRRHVLVVEDIIDPAADAVVADVQPALAGARVGRGFTLLRKPEAAKTAVDVRYVGFDIPNEFVVGYGLDYGERYRNLRVVATLAPHVYT